MTPRHANRDVASTTANTSHRRRLVRTSLGIACGLLAATIWGGGAVVSRHLVTAEASPLDLAFWRYAGAFPVACALLLASGRRSWAKWPWYRVIVLLLLAGPPYHLLVIAGYAHAPAGAGSLVISGLLPVFALILLAVSERHVAKLPAQLCAAACILAGIGLIGFGAIPHSATDISLGGVAIFTFAAGAWALLNHLVQRWGLEPIDLTLFLACSAPLFLPAYWISTGAPFPRIPLQDAALQLTYHGILVGIAATYLFFASIQRAGAPIAGGLQALAPAFAVIFGIMLLSEQISGKVALATALIVFGIFLTARASFRYKPVPAPQSSRPG
jgi:drug/metabolite transporter (DMT)-like permease